MRDGEGIRQRETERGRESYRQQLLLGQRNAFLGKRGFETPILLSLPGISALYRVWAVLEEDLAPTCGTEGPWALPRNCGGPGRTCVGDPSASSTQQGGSAPAPFPGVLSSAGRHPCGSARVVNAQAGHAHAHTRTPGRTHTHPHTHTPHMCTKGRTHTHVCTHPHTPGRTRTHMHTHPCTHTRHEMHTRAHALPPTHMHQAPSWFPARGTATTPPASPGSPSSSHLHSRSHSPDEETKAAGHGCAPHPGPGQAPQDWCQ